MRRTYFMLDADHNLIETEDVHVWGRFFEDTAKRRVALTMVGDAEVSTVFLGIDHNFQEVGPPLLFETMVFGGTSEIESRYSTWDDAVEGHARIVRRLELVRRLERAAR